VFCIGHPKRPVKIGNSHYRKPKKRRVKIGMSAYCKQIFLAKLKKLPKALYAHLTPQNQTTGHQYPERPKRS